MMQSESFLNEKVALYPGDMLAVLPTLAENSIDSCVVDPPYHLTSIVKRFQKTNTNGQSAIERDAAEGQSPYGRSARGFMSKAWDGGDIAFRPETWAAVLRVLKPGAHLLAFGGTRTYHRMACAIEDAGFEIRDMVSYVYGCGFPKSLDVSKAIDRCLGHERKKVRVDAAHVRNPKATGAGRDGMGGATRPYIESAIARGFHEAVSDEAVSDEAVSDEAVSWRGWGTALKPALEPICIARKPLSEPTIAANVLKWGTGAINIDGCRVEFAGTDDAAAAAAAAVRFAESRKNGTTTQSHSIGKESRDGTNNYDPFALKGRWPANLIHDGSEEVLAMFPETHAAGTCSARKGMTWSGKSGDLQEIEIPNDSGSAARFFYTAKADNDDRPGSKHPTVKPLDLIQYLVRLVTPPGGIVLDCFAGTGTTGEAAWREGFRAILIEREEEYQNDIRRRMKMCLAGPDERAREAIKQKLKDKPVDHGPLFGGSENVRGGADRYTASSPINRSNRNDEVVTP